MKKLAIGILTLTITLILIATAQASTWATSVYSYNLGATSTSPTRTTPSNALGAPDNVFLSLGYDETTGEGGWAIFEFDTLFSDEAIILETTNGNRNNWLETADVYISSVINPTDSDFIFITGINNSIESISVDLTSYPGAFRYLKVVDTTYTSEGHPGDGFDINAVAVNPVPEPATMLLMGTGLIGLARVSRKKKK